MIGAYIKRYFSAISVEPVLFLFSLGYGIKYGAGILNQLILDKACLNELGYSPEVCADLASHPEQSEDVQKVANEFVLYQQMLRNFFTAIVSLFIGAISKKVGFRGCMHIAIAGIILIDVQDIINYTFFDVLPLQFLYLESLIAPLFAGFYVGAYGLVSNFAEPSEKAFRFARMDAVAVLSAIFANAVSSTTFRALGNYGIYAISSACAMTSFAYIVFFVREQPKGSNPEKLLQEEKKTNPSRKESLKSHLNYGMLKPAIGLYKVVLRRRPNSLRPLLIVMLLNMMIYYATLTDMYMMYPFMSYKYDVSYDEFALFNAIGSIVNLFSLAVMMPLLVNLFKMHETIVLSLVTFIGGLALAMSAFAEAVVPGMLITYGLAYVRWCCYPIGRSILTKMVEPEEVGNLYAVISLIMTTIGMVANPIYRGLYDATLETLPSSFLLLSSGFFLLSSLISLVLFTQRRKMEMVPRKMNGKEEEKKKNTFITEL